MATERNELTKAEKICGAYIANPNITISELARKYNTSRAQVRRVLKRAGIYNKRTLPPLIIPAPKYKKKIEDIELFICDLHIPHHDERACGAMYREALDLQPTIIYLGGDVLDFHKISFFCKDPEEHDIADEIESAKCFLNQLRNDFPHAEIVFEGGNHVSGRWEKYLSGTSIKGVEGLGIDDILSLDEFNIKYVCASEEVRLSGQFPKIGKLYHLHGDEPKVTYSSVNVARNVFMRLRHNTIFGHFHKSQEYYARDISGDVMACWSVGCLCDLNPAFRPINDWNHGFAIVYYYEDGTFTVENKKIIDGYII